MQKLIATMYLVRKDGKDAYEMRMDGIGFYIEREKMESMFRQLTETVYGLKLPTREPEHVVSVVSTTPKKTKRKYTKRDEKYWKQK